MASTTQKTQDTLGKVADKARDAASTAFDKGKEFASTAADKARDTAENLTTKAGSGMTALADTIREHAPEGGFVGSAAESVADNLERGGRYLEREGLSGMAEDVASLIKRNPIPALFIGVGIGFLLARTLCRD